MTQPIHASDVIQHLPKLRKRYADLRGIVYMRESTWEQRKGGNLRNRHLALRKRLHQLGIPILGQYQETCSGKALDCRPMLREAVEAVQQAQAANPGAKVILVTDARNRFVRGANYNGQADTDPPFEWQLKELKNLAGVVTLATVLHPNASFGNVRRYETKVAGDAGRQFGRPRRPKPIAGLKKERRERLKPHVLKLRGRGESIRSISRRLGVSVSTIGDWLKVSP